MAPRQRFIRLIRPMVTLAVTTLFFQFASATASPSLTLDDLFSNSAMSPAAPSAPAWSSDSAHFAYTWQKPGNKHRRLWVVSADGKTPREVHPSGPGASVRGFVWRNPQTLISHVGNALWTTHIGTGTSSAITDIGAGVSGLSVSPDGRTAAYLKQGDLWLLDLDSGVRKQATSLGIPSLSSLPVGRYSRAEREVGPGIWGGPTYAWSKDSKTIALHVVDRRKMRKVPFPNYLAEETDPNWVRRGYPGDANEEREVHLLDVATGQRQRVPLPEPGARQVVMFSWSAEGALLIDTATDTAIERRTWVVAPGTLQPREIWRSERPSRMYTSFGAIWHPNAPGIVLLSDRADRYGLYAIDASPSKDMPVRLSDPAYDVLSTPTAAGPWLYYSANGEGPSEQHVYRVNTSTGNRQRLTHTPGTHSGYPSPNGNHLVVRSNSDTSPSDLFFIDTERGVRIRLTDSASAQFKGHQWVKPRYVSFPSAIDDYTLHARILEPIDLDTGVKHPVVFGPVYSNTVRNRWRGVYSLMQQYLVSKGYIVVQVDVRGSTGYGRDFREAFLLDFAGDDLEDLSSAVDYLKTLPYVDGERMGIWGSSYGGTLSVYALLKKPGLFHAAAAAASAVDPYFFGTDDVAIVRRPQSHPQIFARQAMKYADNLEDHLLLIHGMQDHVVPFKTTAVLADELIKAGKDFDFAFAPGATHAWSREPHYQRYLFNKLVAFFERHLQ